MRYVPLRPSQVEKRLLAATDANATVRTEYAEVQEGLAVLELPIDVIKERVPYAGGSPIASLPCTVALRAKLDGLGAGGVLERGERLVEVAPLGGGIDQLHECFIGTGLSLGYHLRP